jgi:hypothetical protein
MTRPKKPEFEPTESPNPATGKPKKKADANVKTTAAKPTTPNLVVSTQSSNSSLEESSDLFDLIPLQAYVKLTRWLLISISTFPKGHVARGQF